MDLLDKEKVNKELQGWKKRGRSQRRLMDVVKEEGWSDRGTGVADVGSSPKNTKMV